MTDTFEGRIGFVGLGNVGAKLAGSILRNGMALTVVDLNATRVVDFVGRGASRAANPAELARACDVVITCLPSPAACAAVVEGPDGLVEGMGPGKTWLEMSTTDAGELKRLAGVIEATSARAVECPVSGGCHRAATGNISILVGGAREDFDAMLPLLTRLGRRIMHAGPLGAASELKVMTNYLATANLVTLSEALVTMVKAGHAPSTVLDAITISSGNSFVAETEGQVILNGSRDIEFTMDLVSKDIGLFQSIAEAHDVPLEVSPLLVDIFKDGEARYGPRELSPNIIRRLEEATGVAVLADGYPAILEDDEPEEPGYEVRGGKAV